MTRTRPVGTCYRYLRRVAFQFLHISLPKYLPHMGKPSRKKSSSNFFVHHLHNSKVKWWWFFFRYAMISSNSVLVAWRLQWNMLRRTILTYNMHLRSNYYEGKFQTLEWLVNCFLKILEENDFKATFILKYNRIFDRTLGNPLRSFACITHLPHSLCSTPSALLACSVHRLAHLALLLVHTVNMIYKKERERAWFYLWQSRLSGSLGRSLGSFACTAHLLCSAVLPHSSWARSLTLLTP